MTKFFQTAKRFANNESGATAIEYALLAALISVVVIPNVGSLGTKINGVFGNVTTALK